MIKRYAGLHHNGVEVQIKSCTVTNRLYKYGIDITNATLQTYAYNLGIEKSVSEMTQMEKQQLRVLSILQQSKVSWGDLSNTINSPSNMIRQFNTNIKETGMVLGQIFIPVLQKVMPVVNGTTIAIKRMLVSVASLMGVKIDFDAFGQNGYKDTTDGLEDIANGYDDVAKAADKAQKGVRGFDELNVINTGTDTSKSTGVSGDTIDLTDEIVKATEEYEKVWNDAFDKMENKAEAWADKVQGFFERMFKPFKTWGSKIDWKKLKNGFNSVLDFTKKFVVGTGTGFLDFIEGLSDYGAPLINGLADAIGLLFTAMGKASPQTFTAIGGAIGGFLTAFLLYKGATTVIYAVKDGWIALTTALVAHPIGFLGATVAAFLGSVIALEQELKNQKEIEIYGSTVSDLANNISSASKAILDRTTASKDFVENAGLAEMSMAEDLADKYFALAEKTGLTAGEQELMKQYAQELVGIIPSLSDKIDEQTGMLTIQKDELGNLIETTKEYYRTQAAKQQLISSYEDQLKAEKNLKDAVEARDKAEEIYNQKLAEYNEKMADYNLHAAEYTDANIPNYQPVLDAQDAWQKLDNTVAGAQATFNATQEQIEWLYGILEKSATSSGETTVDNYSKGVENNLPLLKPSLLKIGGKVEEVANDVKDSFESTGKYGIDGFVNGIEGNLPLVENAANNLAKTSLNATMGGLDEHSPSKKFAEIGKFGVLGYNQGIESNLSLTHLTMQKYANSILTVFRVALMEPVKNIGMQTMTGFLNGLTSMEQSVYSKADEIAKNVAKTIQSALDIHSPSRVMFELGAYTTEGFKEGMESLYKPTELSIKDFGFGMVEAVHPQQLYSGYADYTPSVSTSTSTTTQNYYNTSSSVDNAETNALLREQNELLQRILAKEYGISKSDIGKASREYARDFFKRTGRDAYTF